jgi:hypothetical protein
MKVTTMTKFHLLLTVVLLAALFLPALISQ